ncbi:MAG TPA: AarF/ABC1/UbiB kinase family protein [Acidimicrobiales bacterium]|nr:AarF/ABC1/UbiB kinase family protein [Acidimicrobiales bacterium]
MVRRALQLVWVLTLHGAGWLLELAGQRRLVALGRRALGRPRRDERSTPAEHLRRALEELGPTFVKLGQLLSSRADVLPPSYQAELARLQDAAPPEPPGTVEAIVEAELGRPLAEVFARFDPVPLAAASIGQAHAATLAGGEAVVVKVRRPGAVALVEVDLAVLESAVRHVSRWVGTARRLDVAGLVGELARTLRAELDYEAEAAHAERIAADFAGDPTVHVPAVHREASTGRVITLERVAGIKVSDLAALEAAGVDRPALARHIVDVVLTMVFERGFFHADPHPGNLFAEPDGRLGLVDFGMVGVLTPATRARLVRVFIATSGADAAALARELLGLGTATRPVDRDRLVRDLDRVLEQLTGGPLGEVRLGPLLQAELGTVRRHGLRLPAELALLVKTAAMTEGLAAILDPDFMLLPAFAPYAAHLLGPGAPGVDEDAAPLPVPEAEPRSLARVLLPAAGAAGVVLAVRRCRRRRA